MKFIVDPPIGWQYGFPKEAPLEFYEVLTEKEREKWFLEQGYPQGLIDQGMLKHCRFWTTPDES